MPEEERQAYGLRTPAEQQADSDGAKHNAPVHNLTIRDLKKSVDAHDHMALCSLHGKTQGANSCKT